MKKKTTVTVYLLSICLVGIASFGQTKHGVVLLLLLLVGTWGLVRILKK